MAATGLDGRASISLGCQAGLSEGSLRAEGQERRGTRELQPGQQRGWMPPASLRNPLISLHPPLPVLLPGLRVPSRGQHSPRGQHRDLRPSEELFCSVIAELCVLSGDPGSTILES